MEWTDNEMVPPEYTEFGLPIEHTEFGLAACHTEFEMESEYTGFPAACAEHGVGQTRLVNHQSEADAS